MQMGRIADGGCVGTSAWANTENTISTKGQREYLCWLLFSFEEILVVSVQIDALACVVPINDNAVGHFVR